MPDLRECPEIECWQALFGDTVPPDQRESYERHLESCAACQERLDQAEKGGQMLLTLVRKVGNPAAAPVDPTLLQVLERLHEMQSPLRIVATEAVDLFFLRPAERPDLRGTLDEYEVLEVIGQGGFGIVLKAFDPALHRLVAIKVMAPAVAGSAIARQRFTREAKAAAAVCHEHIVTVHGVREADGLPYLVMQYLAGESLQARLDHQGPLEVEDIVRIGLQTASGLAAAHAQGLIHRDIKPANLLLENGLARVKITDFGLARMVDDVQLTQNGVVAGTPEFMAPEQARGDTVDYRADLFSLGSVLYACCTGVAPFRGSTTLALLRKVCEEEPNSLRSLNPNIPVWLETLIVRLMAKDPAQRFQSAAEVAALLEGYLAHLRQPATVASPVLPTSPLAVRPQRPGIRPRRIPRKWLLAAVGLVSVLGLLAALGYSLFGSKEVVTVGPPTSRAGTLLSNEPKAVAPKNGLVCLLVNKKSGRCLSISDNSTQAGAKIVQGPTPDQAGAAERWLLLGTGKSFRLRNESSRLVLEIGTANRNAGVQAIQWYDQATATHQHWTFEPVEEGYVLRVEHSQLVLAIGEGSLDAGGLAVQWDYVPGVPEEIWELLQVTSPSGSSTPARPVKEYEWLFKGQPPNSQLLELVGPDADECVHYEPNGLHITLPTDHQGKRVGTGLGTNFDIQGDFEITMSFEILKEPEPNETGLGTGVFLAVDLNTPNYSRVSITRGMRQGSGFTTWFERSPEGAGKPQTELHTFPTKAKAGRLRLVRTGSLVSHYMAEESSNEFTLLEQHPFGEEEVKTVRIGGQTGGPQAALDARITELRIRAGSLLDLSETATAAGPQARGTGWLLAAELFGLGTTFALLCGLSVWLYLRHRRLAEAFPVPAAGSANLAKSEPARPISFMCSSCGKYLRARVELAGKKVKCSQCGKAVQVPMI